MRSQLPDIDGWMWEMWQAPANWGHNWYGTNQPTNEVFEPGTKFVLVKKIPSHYSASARDNHDVVVVAYVPTNLPVREPVRGFTTPGLQRIKMYIYGPK